MGIKKDYRKQSAESKNKNQKIESTTDTRQMSGIKWQHWINMPKTKLWEACLLSLGLNPKAMGQIAAENVDIPADPPHFKLSAFPSEAVREEYEDRLELLRESIGEREFFSTCDIDKYNPNYSGIRLSEFAAWGFNVGFDHMPLELQSIAKKPNITVEVPATPNNSDIDRTADDWKSKARQIANELFDYDTTQQTRDSLVGYSKRVMEKMQSRKIHGPRGLIGNPKTVQRDALQGEKWWSNKKK